MIRWKLWLLVVGILCGVLLTGYGNASPLNVTNAGYIVVTNPPAADFFTSTRYGSAPFTVSFSDSSSGTGPLTYLWEFGDGSTSQQQNPSHTYRADGDYDVHLTVTNIFGQDTKVMKAFIGVGNPPAANFSASATEGLAPFAVTFADTTKNQPETWVWDFGDNSSSPLANPVHAYGAPGNYTVTLKTSNHFGSDSLVRSEYIRITSPRSSSLNIPSLAAEKKPEGIIDLIRAAKGATEKNLPTSGFIPPQFMALAAVLTSVFVVFIQFLFANVGMLSQFGIKFAKFLADLAGGHAVEKLSEKEIAARGITVRKLERRFFGLSATEVLVIEAAVIMVALAFILADRAPLTLQTVLIYMAVGAISVILHDFAHRYFVTKHGHDADIRFWGLGTIIMFLTAWLYGIAFAQSYRNLVNREGMQEPREQGIEMVAGPCMSILLTILFLALIRFGGILALAGGIGFTINLITAVYSLMPIETMDGLSIWKWNRGIYLGLFIPLIAFYFFTFMIV